MSMTLPMMFAEVPHRLASGVSLLLLVLVAVVVLGMLFRRRAGWGHPVRTVVVLSLVFGAISLVFAAMWVLRRPGRCRGPETLIRTVTSADSAPGTAGSGVVGVHSHMAEDDTTAWTEVISENGAVTALVPGIMGAKDQAAKALEEVEHELSQQLSETSGRILESASGAIEHSLSALEGALNVPVQVQAHRTPPFGWTWGLQRPGAWQIVTVAALAVMIYLAYLFVDSGTRGQFTWPLRIFCVVSFVGICVLLVVLRPGF